MWDAGRSESKRKDVGTGEEVREKRSTHMAFKMEEGNTSQWVEAAS